MTFAVVEAITFEGGLLLLDSVRQRLFIYNASASPVWFSWAAGRSADEISQTLVQNFGLTPEVAERDATGIIEHWRSQGLIPGLCSPSLSIGDVPDSIDWDHQPEPHWSARWSCLIRDLVVSFAIEPTQWVPTVRTLFQHMEVGNAAAAHTRFEIRATSKHESALIQDGVEYMRASHAGAFKDCVHKAILEKLHPGAEWFALIHGGAVARKGVGIGLPAASGSGKSTLIAYLIKNGFEYLSDDILPVTAPEGLVLPWPLPFSVKSGSWDTLLPLYPELSFSPIFSTKGDTARLLRPSPVAWDQEPVALRYLVFPRYDASVAAGLQALSPLNVLERLLRDNVWIGHPLTKTRVEAFLLWLRSIPAFALIYRDLHAAASCLDQIAAGKVSLD